jgi:manganese/zinc/iron transport system permease protein
MNIIQLEIIIIALFVSCAAILPGIFLVLRGVSLMSDAISHAILFGIALIFLLTHNLNSPFFILGASLTGLLTVFCTEMLIQTGRIKKDMAIGLVFPLFFSLGIILISKYARNVHLDLDMVILGELAFAPFNHLIIVGTDIGPYALYSMGLITLINVIFIWFFYKELKIATFDPMMAHILGFSPTIIYYCLMTITSITAVGAFDIVGAIVVVALMITPASTAYLLCNRLSIMIFLSITIGICSTITGYFCASIFDISIAGSIAGVNGIIFLLALLSNLIKEFIGPIFYSDKKEFAIEPYILCSFLLHHQENKSLEKISHSLGWKKIFTKKVIENCMNLGLIDQHNKDGWQLTRLGKLHSNHFIPKPQKFL